MCYSLEQTADLELINQDDETIVVDNFQEIGEHKVISKPSFKEDDEIRVVTLEGDADGETVTAIVTYACGLSGFEVQDVEIKGIPKGYEEESSAEFEFQESDDEF